MRTLRLWCEELAELSESDFVELEKPENHHFVQVLRGRQGEEVELLNGQGLQAKAFCHEIDSKRAKFKILEIRSQLKRKRLTVFSPAPKGKRLPYMLEKLQEIGVDTWVPMETEHSIRDHLSDNQKSKLNERLKEACKQSGCAWKLKIETEVGFQNVLERAHLFALDIGGERWDASFDSLEELSLMIGPEAGWSHAERQTLQDRSIARIGLSPFHLRMETAATIGAARLLESESF